MKKKNIEGAQWHYITILREYENISKTDLQIVWDMSFQNQTEKSLSC